MTKILHTSDWHVGKQIRGRSRADEHREVLEEIRRAADEESVDLIVVGGDLFDSAAPTPEAEEIVYEALLGLARLAPVLVIAGNHDNPRRLRAVQPLLELGRVATVATPRRPESGGVRRFRAADGTPIVVAALPFVSQRGVVRATQILELPGWKRTERYAERIEQMLEMLARSFSDSALNLVVAHLMVAGTAVDEAGVRRMLGGGERPAHIFGEYVVPPAVFPASADYVALGHLHRAQDVDGSSAPARYCGSPLQLDFGEEDSTKSVTIVEFDEKRVARLRERVLSSGRSLVTLRGTLDELEALRGQTRDCWLRVVVEGTTEPSSAELVREWFEDVVEVRLARPLRRQRVRRDVQFVGKSPSGLFADFCREEGVDPGPLSALFEELLEEVEERAVT